MTKENESYLAYVTQPDEGELSTLQALAELQVLAEKKVAEAERDLELAKQELSDLAEHQIPDLMDKIGIAKFTTSAGLMISVDEKIRASIPDENKPKAFAWFSANGHGGLIDRILEVKLGRGQDEEAQRIHEALAGYDVKDKEGVHASTLAAWVREQLAEGKPVPQDLINVYRQRAAKVGYPKIKKLF